MGLYFWKLPIEPLGFLDLSSVPFVASSSGLSWVILSPELEPWARFGAMRPVLFGIRALAGGLRGFLVGVRGFEFSWGLGV